MTHEQKQKMTACVFVGGIYNGQRMSEFDVEQKLCNGKHGSNDAEIRANGGCTHRWELDDVPEVDGYTFMWDGGEIRYESWDVYNMMID